MRKRGSKILIIVLILIIIGLSSFIVYDKVIKKKPRPKEQTEKVKKIEENLDDIAQILVNKLDTYNIDYYDSKENIDFKNITDNELIKGAYSYSRSKSNELKRQDVDDYFLNIFGRRLDNYPNLECHVGDGILFKYDATQNEYVKDCGNTTACHAHGGACTNKSLFMKYKDIKKEGNNYIITVTKVYEPSQGMCFETEENSFYADSNYTVKIPELDQYTSTNEIGLYEIDKVGAQNYYEQNYEKFKNLKPNYIYTFEKVDRNYNLTKFETIK